MLALIGILALVGITVTGLLCAVLSHDFPSDQRQPDILHQFDFFSSSRGLVPTARRAIMVGIHDGTGTAVDNEPIQVFNEEGADEAFGKGSELALMCRKAFVTVRLIGTSPEIWALPIADPGGTPQVSTLITGGTATASGDLVIKLAGRTIVVPIADGDISTVVTTNIEAAFDAEFEKGNLPSTAGSAASTVTLTSTWAALTALDIGDPTVEETVAGLTVTPANVSGGATVVSLATPLDSLLSKRYHALAIAQHDVATAAEVETHLEEAWLNRLWGFGYLGEHGTLGTATTLQAALDNLRVLILAAEGALGMESETAASVAAAVESKAKPNFNFDGFELPLFLPLDSQIWTSGPGGEIEALLAGGVTPLVPNTSRSRMEIVRLITSQTTFNGAPTEQVKDLANPRTVAFTADQLDAVLRARFSGANLEGEDSQETLDQIIDVIYDVLKEEEVLAILKNVDQHFDELIAEIDVTTPTRAVASVPESVVQNLHQIVVIHRLFVE